METLSGTNRKELESGGMSICKNLISSVITVITVITLGHTLDLLCEN